MRLDGDSDLMVKELEPTKSTNQLLLGDLVIDQQAHQILLAGEPVATTPSEYKLMVALASRVGEAVDYVSLVQLVLDYDAEIWEAKELIKRHVFALRRKIEVDPYMPKYILNVRGVGYRVPHQV